jgi:hypothetical protein
MKRIGAVKTRFLEGFLAGFLALALAGCATGGGEPPIGTIPLEISPGTQNALDVYLRAVKSTRPGAFAVSEDGRDSFYVWCEDMVCDAVSYATPAIQHCRGISGKPCLALYVRDQPRVAFSRAEKSSGPGRHGSKKLRTLDVLTNMR